MPGLLQFSKVPEGPASPLWWVARTPFALMQQCPPTPPPTRSTNESDTNRSATAPSCGSGSNQARHPTGRGTITGAQNWYNRGGRPSSVTTVSLADRRIGERLYWVGGHAVVVREQPTIRAAMASDDIFAWVRRTWGDTVMAVHGRVYDLAALPALVAVVDGLVVGVLTYLVEGDALEIVSCDADPPGHGVGRALTRAAVDLAREQSLRQVWCTTTNDNLPALGFWQAAGFTVTALRPGAVAIARELKPTIPTHGHRGLPIRDELDLQLVVHPREDNVGRQLL